MVLMQLLVASVLTAASPAPASHADSFSVPHVSLSGSQRKPVGLPFGLSFTKRIVRTWTPRSAPPVSAHRHDEQGPVIRTDSGILHCEGHLFRAENGHERIIRDREAAEALRELARRLK